MLCRAVIGRLLFLLRGCWIWNESFQKVVKRFGGVGLHAGHQVRVGVQGERDRRVEETFRDHLRVDALHEQDRGMRVTDVVEADVGQSGFLDQPFPYLVQVTRRNLRPDLRADDEV